MEQLYERIDKALLCDVRLLVRTTDNPEKVLARMITEISDDVKQFRQIIDTRIASQQTIETEDSLKEHTHHIAALRSSLLKLETKLSEAQWTLSEFGGDADPGSLVRVKQPKPPSGGPSSAGA